MQGNTAALARLGIMEAAIRLGVSTDTIRRRVRKGELPAIRDNHGQWRLDLPDDAAPGVPMQPGGSGPVSATLPSVHIAMQDAYAAVAGALRLQVADLQTRLDQAEAREAEVRGLAERQGRELTAAVARASIAEGAARGAREAAAVEVRVVRELLAEARRPAWRRWLGLL
jgi:excisionase family DNA binding protein